METKTRTPIASLGALSFAELKASWHSLFEVPPPVFNRRSLEARLAYRIQEFEHGGLKDRSHKRLLALADELDGGDHTKRRKRADNKPIAGTRLVREWKGVEYLVTVRRDGYEFNAKHYKSLSAIAFAITGTRWNGWSFFGLSDSRGRR
ncbi:DUF2924 domain-containing protein [Hyphobacterium indicum]|uniref:DUF2924 domain-containing protein n=1 Tax=Hyphobacterium indicum TaxID=2162714 RepID=UPI000D6599C1|nr:DUF2924 domain-containing protein [Hyphobacterium indicum]